MTEATDEDTTDPSTETVHIPTEFGELTLVVAEDDRSRTERWRDAARWFTREYVIPFAVFGGLAALATVGLLWLSGGLS